jgi:hypothetical protein
METQMSTKLKTASFAVVLSSALMLLVSHASAANNYPDWNRGYALSYEHGDKGGARINRRDNENPIQDEHRLLRWIDQPASPGG